MFNFDKTVIAHRGACGYAPENTIAAMRKAKQVGAQWVEFDVMLTRDEHAIIIHDTTLDRTTNGHDNVANTDYLDIAKLDAGSWFDKQFAGEKVPTFVELLDCLQDLNLHINVEIKPTLGKDIITAQKTLTLLKQHWSSKNSVPLLSGASLKSLQAVREQDNSIALGWITDKWRKDWQTILKDLDCISLHINHEALNAARVAAVKQAGYLLLAYTVNDIKQAKILFDWGVDAIFTNFPDRMLQQ
jgi:glycerophosphoryl diester phosphodiesterase